MISMDTKSTARWKIGGPSHVVQIDECKIGRCKFNRSRVIGGNRILGMIDVKMQEVQMTICSNNNRDADALYNLIAEHIELTSTIYTDVSRGYNGFMAGGFPAHLTVNHSHNFVDSITQCHSSNIESRWRALCHCFRGVALDGTVWLTTFVNICGIKSAKISQQTHFKN